MKALLFIHCFSISSVVFFSVIRVSISLPCYSFCRGSSHISKPFLVACSFGSNLKPLLLSCHCFRSHRSAFLMVDKYSLFFSLLCGQYTCKFITVAKIIVIVPENTCISQKEVLSTPSITKWTYSKLRWSMICIWSLETADNRSSTLFLAVIIPVNFAWVSEWMRVFQSLRNH